jgi:peptidoglycan/xylan/chitin deacetylase (PgdA/CDA1 family)
VVKPIEEGLAKFGITPGELAQQYQLYVASVDVLARSHLIEIGNHSHSHYILSKLSDAELDEDLRRSHEILRKLLGNEPECFAYPFGIPEAHFDERCSRRLRAISAYPYIFSARNSLSLRTCWLNAKDRVCLDNVNVRDVVGAVAKVTPRTLKDWLVHPSPAGE